MPIEKRWNKWHVRFWVHGREYRYTTNLPATKQHANDAREVESQHRRAILDGLKRPQSLKAIEFSDAARQFLEWTKMEHRDKPNTWRRVETSFASLLPFFGNKPVATIEPSDVEAYKTNRVNVNQVRDVTLRHDLHALSKFFRYAKRQRWVRENAVAAVRIPSDAASKRDRVITVNEERQYFMKAAGTLHDTARLMLLQGMRPDEVLRIQKADIDLERRELHIRRGKTPSSRRMLKLTDESARILGRRMPGESLWIFPSPKRPGQPVTKLNGPHEKVCDALGLDIVLYDFRHTFATRMAQAGVDLMTLAAILGHSSLRTVQRYVHPTRAHMDEAMAKYEAASIAAAHEIRVQ